jgi:hypothetical protein
MSFIEFFSQFTDKDKVVQIASSDGILVLLIQSKNEKKLTKPVAHILPALVSNRVSVDDFNLNSISKFQFQNKTDQYLIFFSWYCNQREEYTR